jgi:hypothetical protein
VPLLNRRTAGEFLKRCPKQLFLVARLLVLGAPDQSGREQCGLGGLEQRAERLRAAAKAAAMSSRMMDSIGPMSQSMSLYTLTAAETQRSDVQLLRTSGLTATSEQILKEAIVDNGPSCGLRRSMTATARMSPTLSAPCPPPFVPEAHTSRGGGELRPHRARGNAYETPTQGYLRATSDDELLFSEAPMAAGLLFKHQSEEYRQVRERMLIDAGYDETDAERALTSIRLSHYAVDDVRLATAWLDTKGARKEQLTRF